MHIAALNGQFGLVKYFTKDCQMDPQTVDEVRCVNPFVHVTDVVYILQLKDTVIQSTATWIVSIHLCMI